MVTRSSSFTFQRRSKGCGSRAQSSSDSSTHSLDKHHDKEKKVKQPPDLPHFLPCAIDALLLMTSDYEINAQSQNSCLSEICTAVIQFCLNHMSLHRPVQPLTCTLFISHKAFKSTGGRRVPFITQNDQYFGAATNYQHKECCIHREASVMAISSTEYV